jgi:hypothetical protein
MLVLAPAFASAALLDANCPGPTNAGFSTSAAAQTFTAGHTGTLVRGEMFIAKTAGADFQMYIFNADTSGPTGAPLGTTTVPDSSVANVPSPSPVSPSAPIDGTFDPGVSVTAGQQYAIGVSRSGSGWLPKDRSGDPCSGGEFAASSIAGPWTFQPDYDFPFSIFVNPPNAFTVGKVKGTKVTLNLPGPGGVDIAGPKKKVKATHTDFAAGGSVTARARLTKAGKGVLQRGGKVKVTVTFTPSGGEPSSQKAKLKPKRK